MPAALVIDDRGDVWPLGAAGLRLKMGDGAGDLDRIAYAVRHRGFVLLRLQSRMVRAEMRPALLSPATLIGLYYTLLDWKPEHILLSRVPEDATAHELFDDVAEFAARLERDAADPGIRQHHRNFSLTRRPWRQLARPRHARFAPVAALWTATRGRLPEDLVSLLVRWGIQGRASLLRQVADTSRLVYDHVGSAYSSVGNACLSLELLGQDVEMLPDRDFGENVAESYHAAIHDQQPRLETTSAVIRQPEGDRLWSYYDRIVLPWRSGDGAVFMLGISEVRRRMLAA